MSIDKAINRARLRDDLDVGAIRWTSTVLNMDLVGKMDTIHEQRKF